MHSMAIKPFFIIKIPQIALKMGNDNKEQKIIIENDKNNKEQNENKKSRYGFIKKLTQSATFALLLSIAFFAYELNSSANETREIVNNLEKIQNSLSTRYLGLFPEYIGNINLLLYDGINHPNRTNQRDSIIIFEDVLYYGIRSDAQGFRDMIENILTLSYNGYHITIAYYDENGYPFSQMIRDKLLTSEYQKQYREDMRSYNSRMRNLKREFNSIEHNQTPQELEHVTFKLINKHFDNYLNNRQDKISSHDFYSLIDNRQRVDSIITQHYFELSRDDTEKESSAYIKDLLRTLPQKEEAVDAISLSVNDLCTKLDKIIDSYFNKPFDKITYFDYVCMYKEITIAITDLLNKQPNIELIPLHESLLMSCWMTTIDGESNAIFAFPSKYSTVEIGFISQDKAFVQYIHTMLNGIKGTLYYNKNEAK